MGGGISATGGTSELPGIAGDSFSGMRGEQLFGNFRVTLSAVVGISKAVGLEGRRYAEWGANRVHSGGECANNPTYPNCVVKNTPRLVNIGEH